MIGEKITRSRDAARPVFPCVHTIGVTALSAVQASGSPSGEPDPTVGPQVSKRVTRSTATDSPLIGRGPEYEHLVARLPGARGELSRVIAVTGESGIGKTHVLREVARQARRNG